jgi:hypothetical protein
MRKREREKARTGKKNRVVKTLLLVTGFLICGFFITGCQPNSAILNSKSDVPLSTDQGGKSVNSFEKDLETMKTANFDFIYVMRRKDGGKLDSEDKKYVKANSPAATNRFILSDEEKAVIAGSKYKFEPANLKALQERFNVENFSKPESPAMPQNSDINSNS